uniref:Uncharacterized protein n=1 Tax=Anguilla anguilla TaxID=7936 RepID=A0A0E9RTS3_ANGAN
MIDSSVIRPLRFFALLFSLNLSSGLQATYKYCHLCRY